MSLVNQNIIAGAAGQQGYQISRSVRLRSSASAYFNRTMTTPTNSLKWTWNGWVKLGAVTGYQDLFFAGTSGSAYGGIWFNSGTLCVSSYNGSGYPYNVTSVPVYRDPSAWYMVTIVYDSTQATNTNRIQMWVNNQQITSFTSPTWPTQNTSYQLNTAVQHNIGNGNVAGAGYFDGYLTEINFIDGQALTPSSFGENDAVTGVWKPKKYTGTYGTNGFYLNFADNSAATAAAIGKDYSGNGNNWTPNNISVTSGVTYDSMIDTPTMYADGGNGRGNYAVLNPLMPGILAAYVPTSGNLRTYAANSTQNWYSLRSTMKADTKIYFELTPSQVDTYWTMEFGISQAVDPTGVNSLGSTGYGVCLQQAYNSGGDSYVRQNSATSYTFAGGNWSTSDVFMLAYDNSTGRAYIGRNGTWYNSGAPASGTGYIGTVSTAVDQYPSIAFGASGWNVNFGQRPFTYTPPTGFKALNTQNLPDSAINNGAKYMAATTYTGNGATGQTISNGANTTTGTTFQPDLVWVKSRSNAYDNGLQDSVRGATKDLNSNNTDAEETRASSITAFASNGFTLGGNDLVYNGSGATYVGWQWKANGSAVSNTAGSITSQVNAGVSQGFSVVTYTGTGANATVGHGLGVAPKMIILKTRSTADYWVVWQGTFSGTEYLTLNTTNAKSTAATYFNSTVPTSTVFSLGTDTRTNGSGTTFVAYCWSEVAGYSKFGSYTGNGSTDGPFVYCGFRPRFIMVKNTGTTANWAIIDTARDAYNVQGNSLFPNLSLQELSASSYYVDVLSNGFKLRNGSTDFNVANTYIFAAFAENPFKNSLAR